MERPQSQWGAGTPQDYAQQPTAPGSTSGSGSPQQQQQQQQTSCTTNGTGDADVTSLATTGASNGRGDPGSSLASPVPSPYPAAVAEPPGQQPAAQQPPQTHEDDLQQPSPEQQAAVAAAAALTEAADRAASAQCFAQQHPPQPQVHSIQIFFSLL